MERNTGRGDKTGAQRASVFIRIRHIDQADTVDARLLWLFKRVQMPVGDCSRITTLICGHFSQSRLMTPGSSEM